MRIRDRYDQPGVDNWNILCAEWRVVDHLSEVSEQVHHFEAQQVVAGVLQRRNATAQQRDRTMRRLNRCCRASCRRLLFSLHWVWISKETLLSTSVEVWTPEGVEAEEGRADLEYSFGPEVHQQSAVFNFSERLLESEYSQRCQAD